MNKHEVLTGPYRSGKSWRLLERAVEHCLEAKSIATSANNQSSGLNDETIIIVPSQRYRTLLEQRLQSLLKANGNKASSNGLWGLKILTFYQFCQMSLLKAGIFLKVLPEAARSPLLLEISNQLVTEGQIEKLAPILGLTGTQSSILSLIDEWQRAGYQSAEISEHLKKYEQTSGHRAELGQIYQRYEKTLQEINYSDNHGLVFKLIELLNRTNKINWLSKLVIVDGFDRLNPLQIKLLSTLAKHVPELYVSFDYEESEGDEALYDEYSWKTRSYEQLRTLLSNAFEFKSTQSTAQLAHSNTTCFAASDRLAEMSIIAARVKEAIITDKVPVEEIVVTARNLKLYKSAIEAAFQDAGLEYYIDEAIAMNALPIVRFLLSCLSLANNDFPRRQVIDCLRSPYFKHAAFQLTAESIEQLNELSLQLKIVGEKENWLQAIRNNPNLSKVLKEFFDLLTPPNKIISAISYVSWVEDMLDRILDLSMIGDHLSPQLNWAVTEAVANFRRILAALIQEESIVSKIQSTTTKNVTDSDNYGQAKSEHYLGRLEKLLEKANFPAPKYSERKVLVTSAELVPNRLFKQIYLAGMLEGEFPAIKASNGFLTKEELGQWKHLGIEIYNPRQEAGFEYALFASLLNRAHEKFTLSYPVAEISSGDEEAVPSFFLTSVGAINEDELPEPLSFESGNRVATSPRNAVAYSLWQEQTKGHENKTPQVLFGENYSLSTFINQLEEKLHFAANRAQQSAYSSLNGYLTDHVAASTVKINLPEYWSASQLSAYGKCPFYFWLERMLKIAPHEEPELGLSFMDRGTFYHKALELFYKAVIDKQMSISNTAEKELEQVFDQAITQALSWLEQQNWFHPTEFWEQDKNQLIFRLKNFYTAERNRFLAENGQYTPHMVEASFGPQEQYSPLIMKRGDKTLKIRGKIDRIDIDHQSGGNKILRLVDYKSGSGIISKKDFESGRNMQLPLYALATKQSIVPNSNIGNYMYLSIRTGEYLSSKKQDNQSISEDLQLTEEKIFDFVDQIEKGDFSVNPSDPNLCITCVHQTVCRVKEFPNRGKEGNNGD